MNKVIIGVIGFWLIALTYVQFKPEPNFAADENATIIAYVHGDSLQLTTQLCVEATSPKSSW